MKKREEMHPDKQAGEEIVIRSRFLSRLDNFWYHYKWHVIAIAFFVLVAGVGFVQCGTQNKDDVIITFAGGYTLSGAEREQIKAVFDAIAPAMKEGDERLTVGLNTYSIYTEEELRQQATNPDTGEYSAYAFSSAKQVNTNHLQTFSTYVETGSSAVWLVSEYVYRYQNLEQISVRLEDSFDTLPQGAYDACAIRLADTELYRYYDALKVLPEDTLILLPKSFAYHSVWISGHLGDHIGPSFSLLPSSFKQKHL